MDKYNFFPAHQSDNTSAEILASLKRQEKQSKIRTFFSAITCLAIVSGVSLACYFGYSIFEPVNSIVAKAPEIVSQVEQLSTKAAAAIDKLNALELQDSLDSINALSDEATNLLKETSSGLKGTLDGINKIDFAALNDSIISLANVTNVLNSLFGR